MKRLHAFWRRHFLGVEAVVASAPVLGLVVWFIQFDGTAYVDEFVSGNRANIYRTTAAIAGTLLGFSITVASLVLSFASSERLSVLRSSSQYPLLWRTFFQTTRLLGALTITALLCLILDRETAPLTWLVIPFCFLVSMSIVRLLRVIWILEQIIEIVSKPSPDTQLAADVDAR